MDPFYLFTLFASSCIGVFCLKKLDKSHVLLFGIVAYTLCHELVVHKGQLGAFNQYLYWIYASVTTCLYLVTLSFYIDHRYFKRAVRLLGIGACLFGLIYASFFAEKVFPSIFIVFTMPLVVISCLMVFFSLLQKRSSRPLSSQPVFISTTAIFIYHSISFTHLGCQKYLILSQAGETDVHDLIHLFSSILFYATLGYSFLLSRWNSKNVTSTA